MDISNDSVLNKIMVSHKLEELAQLNVIEIINYLITNLNERERDVINRRYGLKNGNKEILEGIGKAHGLTRERVRQIEVSSLEKLRKARDLERIKRLKKIIIQILEEHGGLIERDYLFDVLVHFSTKSEGKKESARAHQNSFDFLLTKILNEDFSEVTNSPHFKPSYKLTYYNIDHLEEIAKELENKIAELKDVVNTKDMIELSLDLESYKKHNDRFEKNKNIDLKDIWKNKLFNEDYDLINKNKELYSIMKASKNVKQNVFGHWGISNWPEIKPKNINDKIYLVLKNLGRNLHFAEIADKINEIGFDSKKANIASIHNELILDNKYVLVGRGIYGLKEWGLEKGTVADVIEEILIEENRPLNKDEIIEKVLDKRTVKKTTIILALSNKDKFDRSGNKYQLKSQEIQEQTS